jgi:SMODS and SLOG-associating 2TM effector domain family 5
MDNENTISEETPTEALLKSLKVTAGCRFIASKRLAYHDKTLTCVTAFASAYVIGITLMPYFMKLPAGLVDLYNFVTVGLSIIYWCRRFCNIPVAM